MARTVGRLSALTVARLRERGRYPDGGGLYLQIGPSGARSWLFRFMQHGRAYEMGLGSLHTIGLAEARQRALACRRQLLDGTDPLAPRREAKRQAQLSATKSISFKNAAKAYITAHQAGWKNANRHRSRQSLKITLLRNKMRRPPITRLTSMARKLSWTSFMTFSQRN